MTLTFATEYSTAELEFINRHGCEIISKIKLPKSFLENGKPRRMLKYGCVYIAEICGEEGGAHVWAVLSKWNGVYRFSSVYDGLDALERGL